MTSNICAWPPSWTSPFYFPAVFWYEQLGVMVPVGQMFRFGRAFTQTKECIRLFSIRQQKPGI
jgi:hypothetical protein